LTTKKVAVVVTRVYDLILWLLPKLEKFPRSQKFLLGDRIETALFEILEFLIEANYCQKNRAEILVKINLKLDILRFLMRIAKDMRYVDFKAFEYQARLIDEVGRMVGGWKNQAASS